jgi:SagB-type dehydrogenase family enzyme
MAGNRDTAAALSYHERTKHSVESVRRDRHVLDWAIQPRPFKVYVDLEAAPLPRDFDVDARPALEAIAGAATAHPAAAPDLISLARLLHFSAGVTRRRTYPGGEVFYRAAACTGALYHIDLYLVTGPLADLDAGVYHFGPHDFALRCLRRGDFRGSLVAASGGAPALVGAPAALVCTSTFWRNAWKYRARTYRHCFWDSGTILANLLSVAAAANLPAEIVAGFADEEVNALLDVDPRREAALAIVALGRGNASPPSPPAVTTLSLETLPLSEREVDYPDIDAVHEASSLPSGAEAATWRHPFATAPAAKVAADRRPLPPLPPESRPRESIESVILRRGSARRFGHAPIRAEELGAILAATTVPASDFAAPAAALADAYLIVNAVDGIDPGAYSYDREGHQLSPLRHGQFRPQAGHLCLGQELGHDAAVNIYWLADLAPILERFGNRGYRAAQLDAAIAGGKAYLAAYALRLGATGLTFFDDEVTGFFSPHAAEKSVLFLLAVGHSARGGSSA